MLQIISLLKRCAPFIPVLLPSLAFAHEVYVLDETTVLRDLQMPSLQVFAIIYNNAGQFFVWGFLAFWIILTVFSISISKTVEKKIDPLLMPLKRYAPLVARITLGLAMTFSGLHASIFGPELSMSRFLPPDAVVPLSVLLIVLGMLITVGLLTRIACLILMAGYVYMWLYFGTYMFTYINYFGEMMITLILGNRMLALDSLIHKSYPSQLHNLLKWVEGHAFLIMRVAFGISLIFASVYAKFLHAQLAIDTVVEYHLTKYFPFPPEFIVLGAFVIEVLLGLFILLGIEVRFASLFLLFFLGLSMLYFGEAVWPHVVLAGGAIAIFMNGYDRYTLQWGLMRKMFSHAREPVL